MNHDLELLAARIRDARRITVVTGAGVSAASGVPTFRGEKGLWKNHRPEELATPQAFARDPKLVWGWYDWRRTLIAKCEPNPAHRVLADWSKVSTFTLITQNVDGLHERAGTNNVIRFHGSIWEMRCTGGCAKPWIDRTAPLEEFPPTCPTCGAMARPGVVWFGESIDPRVLTAASAAARQCDVFLSVGTSSVVYPAAGLVQDARQAGAFTAEINPVASDAAGTVDVAIAMPAEEALPRVDRLSRQA